MSTITINGEYFTKLGERRSLLLEQTQGDYDGRGQQSCKCNFVHFYSGARPLSSLLQWVRAPMLTPSLGCDWLAG